MMEGPDVEEPRPERNHVGGRKLRFLQRWYEDVQEGLPLLGTPDDVARNAAAPAAGPADKNEAGRHLVSRYTALSGATGFLCGLPGYLSMPLTIPTNVAGVLLLQLHMSQALALLYGQDPALEEVRDRCLRELLDEGGRGPARPQPAEPDETEGLAKRVLSKLGERAVRFAGEQVPRVAGRGSRSLPLLGGVVGGFADARATADAGLRLRQVLASAAP